MLHKELGEPSEKKKEGARKKNLGFLRSEEVSPGGGKKEGESSASRGTKGRLQLRADEEVSSGHSGRADR